MAKSLCRLLINENDALVTNFSVANMSYIAICEISLKNIRFTVQNLNLYYLLKEK